MRIIYALNWPKWPPDNDSNFSVLHLLLLGHSMVDDWRTSQIWMRGSTLFLFLTLTLSPSDHLEGRYLACSLQRLQPLPTRPKLSKLGAIESFHYGWRSITRWQGTTLPAKQPLRNGVVSNCCWRKRRHFILSILHTPNTALSTSLPLSLSYLRTPILINRRSEKYLPTAKHVKWVHDFQPSLPLTEFEKPRVSSGLIRSCETTPLSGPLMWSGIAGPTWKLGMDRSTLALGPIMDLPIMHDSDRYDFVRDIGSGNFGIARLMRDKLTKELVAVKYIERGDKVSFGIFYWFQFPIVNLFQLVVEQGHMTFIFHI